MKEDSFSCEHFLCHFGNLGFETIKMQKYFFRAPDMLLDLNILMQINMLQVRTGFFASWTQAALLNQTLNLKNYNHPVNHPLRAGKRLRHQR